MKKTFKVNVNNDFNFTITDDDIQSIDTISKDGTSFHILHQNQSLEAKIINANFFKKTYNVTVDGTNFDISIEDDLAALIKEMGLSLGTTKQVNSVKAPMPGLIIDINVKEGQEINENDALIIVEAMKMENTLMAPRNGIIKKINVAKGDAVDKGALLIELE